MSSPFFGEKYENYNLMQLLCADFAQRMLKVTSKKIDHLSFFCDNHFVFILMSIQCVHININLTF